MKVVFKFTDKSGSYKPSDDIELDLDTAQITALLGSDVICLPIKFGFDSTTVKRGKIKESEFDIYHKEPTLNVTVAESRD